MLHVGENRRLDEHAGPQIRATVPPENAASAFLLGNPDVVENLLELRPGRDRTDLVSGERRIAHLGVADECDQLLQKLVVDASLQQKS